MASRSVIFRLTILMASFWLMPRMCMVTIIFPSASMKSVRIRSCISGARIWGKDTAPYRLPMRKVRVSPEVEGGRRNEVLHRKAAGREPVPFKGKLAALRVKDIVKQLQPFLPVQHMSRRPMTFKRLRVSVSMRANLARAAGRFSASMVRVTYLVFT